MFTSSTPIHFQRIRNKNKIWNSSIFNFLLFLLSIGITKKKFLYRLGGTPNIFDKQYFANGMLIIGKDSNKQFHFYIFH